MATTWPALLASDVISGEGSTLSVWQGYIDRDQCLVQRGWTLPGSGSAAGTTSTTYSTVYLPFAVRLPYYVRSGYKICADMYLKCASVGVGTMRLTDVGSGTNGTEPTATGGTYTFVTSKLTVPDDTWAGTVRDLGFHLKTSNVAYTANLWTNDAAAITTVLLCNVYIED